MDGCVSRITETELQVYCMYKVTYSISICMQNMYQPDSQSEELYKTHSPISGLVSEWTCIIVFKLLILLLSLLLHLLLLLFLPLLLHLLLLLFLPQQQQQQQQQQLQLLLLLLLLLLQQQQHLLLLQLLLRQQLLLQLLPVHNFIKVWTGSSRGACQNALPKGEEGKPVTLRA